MKEWYEDEEKSLADDDEWKEEEMMWNGRRSLQKRKSEMVQDGRS
jgi:hypothetical protein